MTQGAGAVMNVLGMDFGGTKVALRMESGSTHVEERLRIGAGEQAEEVIARTFDVVRGMQARLGKADAVGVATPGIVLDERIDLAPNVDGWSELDLAERLREAFGSATVSIDNDVKAAALAESRDGALRDASVGLYVNLGTGIAICPVVDGQPLRGAHGAAGEVGYGVVGSVAEWDAKTLTLEEYAGGSGLGRRAAAATDVPADDAAGLLAACQDSVAAQVMWRDALDEIARHLVTAALTVDPSLIAVGGGMTRAGTALMDPLTARLTESMPYPPHVVLSRFGPDASLRGAILLARDALSARGLPQGSRT